MEEKKTRFYLIRHGETLWNRQGRYQGSTDIELSEEGLAQAELMAKRFRYLPLDAVYVSPLKRARATADAIARETGLTPVVEDRFREINFGEWEGKSIPELQEIYGQAYRDFYADPFSHPFPGEGSFAKVTERSMEAFEELLKKHEGQRVAIVSHGGLLRVLLVAIMGMDLNFYRKTWMTNTSITTVDVMADGRRLLMTLNDKAHLEMAELLNKGE
ncbi:histidine phosphatase family protein [Anaerotignum lactatifermentans]|uniref:Histidine phosphatase family protein n=1 Tax=Anaerotignum lactatifermentans TaxID=160404 RepID=A0ABS2G7K1_9FIRM|nr:histidine phosphatase family protein [Anaerotignum lactatifermentans]MBM6828152.1 histidine phosphatase family protein [Anaerotignum lactatifermentans]MBM6876685.1 histidine phosphatase family protein [Anaerotignum lactatifermentans]MBM6949735.1 histidine phosphatase family protein [Anaerotignum lactatifermentans]